MIVGKMFDMKTSTRFAVATHILTVLYVHEDTPVPSSNIAQSVNTSAAVIRQILMRLSEAGLVRSQMGPGGGSLLAKAADEITLLDVWKATEDEQVVCMPRNEPSGSCCVGQNILDALGQLDHDLQEALKGALGSKTLEQFGSQVVKTCDQEPPIEVAGLNAPE